MLIFGLIFGLMFELSGGLIVGLSGGLSGGLMFGLMFGLSNYEIEQKISINQGIWKSLKFGLIQSLIVGLSGGLIGGLGVFIKHFILRQLLYANGFAPWNYDRFLVSCSDCLLLQRVGGRFRFIHKTVQEHFAAMNFEKP